MKKILFVVESLSGGGAEKVLLTLVKNLNKEKYDITVFTIVETGIYVNEMKKYCQVKSALKDYNEYSVFGRLYYKIKMKLIYNLNIKFVYRWLIKKKYDIEIAFVEGFDTKLVAASNNKNSKKYAWIHIDMIDRPYADKYFKNLDEHKQCYSIYNLVICVSKQAKSKYEKKFGIHNTTVIYNPIDKLLINTFRKKYKIDDKIKLCAIGRLEYQKGFDRLIKAVANLKNYNFQLTIIGNGSEMENLNILVDNLKLNKYVNFTGFLENPYKVMSESNLLICSSRSEGYSLVIAEGLCLGIPVLTTNCTGPLELIEHGKFGFLVENSQLGIEKGLLKIFNNPMILENFHLLALQRSSIFGINKTLKKVEAILDE